MGGRWWRALAEDVFGVVLGLVGCALLSVGFVDDRDAVVVIGAGLMLAGAFSNRLRRAKAGPAGAVSEGVTGTAWATGALAIAEGGATANDVLALRREAGPLLRPRSGRGHAGHQRGQARARRPLGRVERP